MNASNGGGLFLVGEIAKRLSDSVKISRHYVRKDLLSTGVCNMESVDGIFYMAVEP